MTLIGCEKLEDKQPAGRGYEEEKASQLFYHESEGPAEIPEKTPVTAKSKTGTAPKLVAKGETVECTSDESSKGEIVGHTGKLSSVKLTFVGCAETGTKSTCTTEGQASGHIVTALLSFNLFLKGVSEGGGFIRNAEDKEGESKQLAQFKCGEKAVTVSGCIPGKVSLAEANKVQEVISEKEAEAEEASGHKFNCHEEAFGTKSEQVTTEVFSYIVEEKAATLELAL
jgi:hypothetical protein